MTKVKTVEKACRKAGMVPVARGKIGGYDFFVADGYSDKPHIAFRRFGVEKGEFPLGAYATLWMLSNDGNVRIAGPVFFEPLHDAEYDKTTKQQMRINSVAELAQDFLASEKRVRADGREIRH